MAQSRLGDTEATSEAARRVEPHRAALPRAVVVLGWVSFFADVSSEMAYPLLPLFVVGVLGASGTSLGWVEGVATAIVALMAGWAGWRSDHGRGGIVRRTPWIRWGYGLPIAGKAIIAGATGWGWVMLGRGIDRVGKGLRGSPRDALIADAAGEVGRGRAFGFHRMMDTAGATVGVLVAAWLVWWLGRTPGAEAEAGELARDGGHAIRIVLWIAAGMGVASFALTFLVREASDRPEGGPDGSPGAREATPRGAHGLSASYWSAVTVMLLFALANSSDAFLLLRAKEVGLEPWSVVLAYALYNAVYAAGAYPAGIVSDRLGRWRVMALGWGGYVVVYAGFAMLPRIGGSGAAWPLLALYGVYMALTDGVAKALIADHAPAARHGTAMGMYAMLSAFATLAASVAAGVLWDRAGHEWTFWVGSALAGVALVALAMLRGLDARSARRARG